MKKRKDPPYHYKQPGEIEFNEYGELKPSRNRKAEKLGENFYSLDGDEFYFLAGPHGERPKRIWLNYSVLGRNMMGYINDLIRRGKLEFHP